MYVDADGLQIACEAPDVLVAGEPLDLLVLIAGSAGTPALTATLAVDGGEPAGHAVVPGDLPVVGGRWRGPVAAVVAAMTHDPREQALGSRPVAGRTVRQLLHRDQVLGSRRG